MPLIVALIWFAVEGKSVPLDGSISLDIVQMGLQALFAAVMGVAIGAVLRNQVAAIVGLLVWVLVVESIVSGLIPVTAKCSRSAARPAHSRHRRATVCSDVPRPRS